MNGISTLSDGVENIADDNNPAVLLGDLLQRADTLLREFKVYHAYLQQHQTSQEVETRIFRRGVESEFKSLLAITQNTAGVDSHEMTEEEIDLGVADEETQSKRLHVLRSSNLPFYEAIWRTAKLSREIKALGKRVYWTGNHVSDPRLTATGKSQRKTALVDLISDDGLLWTKVSIVSEKRLLFDMAKEGWEGYGGESESSDQEYEDQNNHANECKSKLELVRLAEILKNAVQSVRIRYRHPTIRFVLPRLVEGNRKEVDDMIADIRATGAVVECGSQQSSPLTGLPDYTLNTMLPSSHAPTLTPILNIDCTILLALISDISHLPRNQLPPPPTSKSGTYHTAISKQIESEEESPLLPSEIYPTLAGRQLTCTHLAAQRMREIVNTMGTMGEKTRADAVLGEGMHEGKGAEELRRALRHSSTYETPDELQLPIKVVPFIFPPDSPSSNRTPNFPSEMALKLSTTLRLSSINSSVFFYGWMHDIVTITSNRVVATQIEKGLNEILDREEERENGNDSNNNGLTNDFNGSKLWVCDSARSLVGKDKQGGLRS